MRAVVVHGAGDVRVEERPDPAAGPGEVVLDLEWGGLCGSDLSYWRHGASGTSVIREPLVLGHEVAGRVRALGAGVSGVEIGQPVTVHPATLVGDGIMPDRLAGRTNLYPEIRYLGSAAFLPHTDGALAEQAAVRADQLRPLPEGVSTLHGALAEPLGGGDARRPPGRGRARPRRAGQRRRADRLARGRRAAVRRRRDRHRRRRQRRRRWRSPGRWARTTTLDVSGGGACRTTSSWSSRRPASPRALGGVLHATARGGTLVQVGNLPGEPSPGRARRPGHPGDHLDRLATGSSTRSPTRWRAMAAGLDVSPRDHAHVRHRPTPPKRMRVAADPVVRQQQGACCDLLATADGPRSRTSTVKITDARVVVSLARPQLRHAGDRDRGRPHRHRRRHPQRPRAGRRLLPPRPRLPAADRPRRPPDRGHLAVPLQGRLLAARTGDHDGDRRRRRRAVGHQGQGRRACRCTSCSAVRPGTG